MWPDRKLLVIIYLMATVLVPYVLDPSNPKAWQLWKSYFPGTYYFYGGALFFVFFGTVKQWNRWRTVIWTAAGITIVAMAPLVFDAWIPGGLLSEQGARLWRLSVAVVGIAMMGYCGMAVWRVLLWMQETRDENYSNPDDFPTDFARRVLLMPVVMTAMVWPGFILDSPRVMAVMAILLAIFNVVLLLNVLPAWRKKSIVAEEEPADLEEDDEAPDLLAEERTQKIAEEIEKFVKTEKAYLDAHLKLEHVVARCSYSRTYVSQVFRNTFGGFSHYVNSLRLEHYDRYMEQHPTATKDTAAQESGFTSYTAYYKVRERLEKK
jgi:AraC-like DNA-binding protein